MPPDMPAAKFRPVSPRMTTRPPVMYSPTVVTDTLDDGSGTGVADGESLGGDTAEEAGTAGSTVQGRRYQ